MGPLTCHPLTFKQCIHLPKDAMSGAKLKNVNDLSRKVYCCNTRSTMTVGLED